MLVGVLTALGVLGAIGLLVVLFLQRGRDGMDVSLGGLLRLYLYLASLAGVIAFAIGIAGIVSFVLAAAFGLDVVYGGQIPRPEVAPACVPNTPCPPFPQPLIPEPALREMRPAAENCHHPGPGRPTGCWTEIPVQARPSRDGRHR